MTLGDSQWLVAALRLQGATSTDIKGWTKRSYQECVRSEQDQTL